MNSQQTQQIYIAVVIITSVLLGMHHIHCSYRYYGFFLSKGSSRTFSKRPSGFFRYYN